MLDPLAESVRIALEMQRSLLWYSLQQLRDATQRTLPADPSPEWRGRSREAYARLLGELRGVAEDAQRAIETAHESTVRARTTLMSRVD